MSDEGSSRGGSGGSSTEANTVPTGRPRLGSDASIREGDEQSLLRSKMLSGVASGSSPSKISA